MVAFAVVAFAAGMVVVVAHGNSGIRTGWAGVGRASGRTERGRPVRSRAEGRSSGPVASAISSVMRATVASQPRDLARSSPRRTRSPPGPSASAASTAASNAAGSLSAMWTISDHCRTTSRTGVLTTGRPVAIYSSPLVGLMYWVARLMAKGIRHTSNARQ